MHLAARSTVVVALALNSLLVTGLLVTGSLLTGCTKSAPESTEAKPDAAKTPAETAAKKAPTPATTAAKDVPPAPTAKLDTSSLPVVQPPKVTLPATMPAVTIKAPTPPRVAIPKPAALPDVTNMTVDDFDRVYTPIVKQYVSKAMQGYPMAVGLLGDPEMEDIVERMQESVDGLNDKMTDVLTALPDDAPPVMVEIKAMLEKAIVIDNEFKERLEFVRTNKRR